MKKHALRLCLALLLALGLLVTAAIAEEPYSDEFSVQDDRLSGYSGPGGDIVIPDGITSIGAKAFYNRKDITSVTIPDSVTTIGDLAFSGTGLTSLTVPESVTMLGSGAFKGCTALTSIDIPAGTDLGKGPFADCPNLMDIHIDPANEIFNDDGYSDSASGYHPYELGPFTIADGAVRRYNGSATRVVIPEGITRVYGFRDSKVQEVVLPSTLKEILPQAFLHCKDLTAINFPEGLTTIGKHAFSGCSSLTEIELPDSVTGLDCVFSYGSTSLKKVTLGRGLTEETLKDFYDAPIEEAHSPYPLVEGRLLGLKIQDGVLTRYGRNAASVVIPEGVTAIGRRAFYECTNLTSVTIPDTVTSIGEDAFCKCTGLTSVVIPDSVTSIEWGAFSGCTNLKSAKVGSGVTYVGSATVFGSCPALTDLELPPNLPLEVSAQLQGFDLRGTEVYNYHGPTDVNVVIPEGVTKVSGLSYFITTVTYPSTLTTITYIPESARDVYIPASVTAIENVSWASRYRTLTIHCAPGSYAETFAKDRSLKYVTDMEWKTSDQASEHRFTIEDGVLYKYDGPGGHVTIPDGVVSVDRYAFAGRLTVTGLTVPDGVISLNLDCPSVKELSLPGSVVSLELNCPKVEELFIPKSVKSGSGIFDIGRKRVEFEKGCTLFKAMDFATNEANLVYTTKNLQEVVNNPSRTWANHIAANRTIREAWKDPYKDIGTPTPRVRALANEICAGLTTDRAKAEAISRWVVGNIEYDYDYYYAGLKNYSDVPFDPDNILDKEMAVCAGFARLTQALMNAQGIPCLYVMGWTPNGLHAWNLALVDGEYLYYDNTWGEYFIGVGEACISLWHIPTSGAATFDNVKGPGHIISVSIDPATRQALASEIGYDPYTYIPISTNPTNTEGASVDPSQQTAAQEETNQVDQAALDPTLSDWALEEVSAALAAELVPDDIQSNYTWYLTRQEFCRLMVKLVEQRTGKSIDQVLASKNLTLTDPFSDTHHSEVRAAYALGIVKGTGGDVFDPYGSITRQEAATMLGRTARVLGISGGQGDTFTDADTFPDWAREGIAFASGLADAVSGNKVMQGTGGGRFSPLMTYSREQGIVTALRMFRAE